MKVLKLIIQSLFLHLCNGLKKLQRMIIDNIPVKEDATAQTDVTHELSAEETNAVVAQAITNRDNIASLQSTAESLEARIVATESSITSLDSDNSTNKANIGSLQQDMSNAESNIEDLQQDVQTQQGSINTLNLEVANLIKEGSAGKVDPEKIAESIAAKQDKITATGILKGAGNGNIQAATAGTDYVTPSELEESTAAKQDKITATGVLYGTGSSVRQAVAGVEYLPHVTAGNGLGLNSSKALALSVASANSAGAMSAAHYSKVEGIAAGANVGFDTISDGTNTRTITAAQSTILIGSGLDLQLYPQGAIIRTHDITASNTESSGLVQRANFNNLLAIGSIAECSTTYSTSLKEAALSGFVLQTGVSVFLHLSVTNTASNPSLNVNNTGAFPIMFNGSAPNSKLVAGYYHLIFDGSYWQIVGGQTMQNSVTSIQCGSNSAENGAVKITAEKLGLENAMAHRYTPLTLAKLQSDYKYAPYGSVAKVLQTGLNYVALAGDELETCNIALCNGKVNMYGVTSNYESQTITDDVSTKTFNVKTQVVDDELYAISEYNDGERTADSFLYYEYANSGEVYEVKVYDGIDFEKTIEENLTLFKQFIATQGGFIPTLTAGIVWNSLSISDEDAKKLKWANTILSCTTEASTAEKVVSASGFELLVGVRVLVQFTYANSVESPTLNVNSTGAKPIVVRGTALSSHENFAGLQELVYDGYNWNAIGI